MHSAKPPIVPINANTTNGRTADTSVSDPMNDAVNRHVRPQTVHDSKRLLRYLAGTNSAVLDSNSTWVIEVNILTRRATVITRTVFVLSATEIEIGEREILNYCSVRIAAFSEGNIDSDFTFFQECRTEKHHNTAKNVQQSNGYPLPFGIQNKQQPKQNANNFRAA